MFGLTSALAAMVGVAIISACTPVPDDRPPASPYTSGRAVAPVGAYGIGIPDAYPTDKGAGGGGSRGPADAGAAPADNGGGGGGTGGACKAAGDDCGNNGECCSGSCFLKKCQ